MTMVWARAFARFEPKSELSRDSGLSCRRPGVPLLGDLARETKRGGSPGFGRDSPKCPAGLRLSRQQF